MANIESDISHQFRMQKRGEETNDNNTKRKIEEKKADKRNEQERIYSWYPNHKNSKQILVVFFYCRCGAAVAYRCVTRMPHYYILYWAANRHG